MKCSQQQPGHTSYVAQRHERALELEQTGNLFGQQAPLGLAAGIPGLCLSKWPQDPALKGTLPSPRLYDSFVCPLDALVLFWWFARKALRTTWLCTVLKHLGTKHQAGANPGAPLVQHLSFSEENSQAQRGEGLAKATKLHNA